MREARILAGALARDLGSPVRAVDEFRFLIYRRALPDLVGAFIRTHAGDGRPAVVLDTATTGRDREALFALALAHHVLRHRALHRYSYGHDGALYDSEREEAEARVFAVTFLQHAAQPAAQRDVLTRRVLSRAR